MAMIYNHDVKPVPDFGNLGAHPTRLGADDLTFQYCDTLTTECFFHNYYFTAVFLW